MRLLGEVEPKCGSSRGDSDSVFSEENLSFLLISGEDAVILISGEGEVYLFSIGELLCSTAGDEDKLTTGEDTWVPISENVKLFCLLGDGSGEGLLDPVLLGEAGLSRLGEVLVFFNSGLTVSPISSGVVTETAEGGGV